MKIRSISQDELDLFARFSKSPETFKNFMLNLWEGGECRPDWCFVAEDGNEMIGRVAYWRHPGVPEDILLEGLALPWDQDYLAIGEQLVSESLAKMKDTPAKILEYIIYSDDPHAQQRAAVMDRVGIQRIQEKTRFVRYAMEGLLHGRKRLVYRSLEETGKKLFLEAITRATMDTLDRGDLQYIKRLGLQDTGVKIWNILNSIQFEPTWWELAFTKRGELVGLIVPQAFDDKVGAVNYLGVVPEQRGHGYGYEIMIRGAMRLHLNGIERIIADVDILNLPTCRLLQRANFMKETTLWWYLTDL